jgi:hypothetical protein
MRLRFLIPTAILLAGVLIAEAALVLYFVETNPATPALSEISVGLTSDIGTGLFTTYLLPFEITSVLLLMAIVGAMTLARRASVIPPGALVIPGAQVLKKEMIDKSDFGDATPVVAHSTQEAARLLGVDDPHDPSKID